jgi:hypothetical protein
MKGLDNWITGNDGYDHPDNREPCAWCDDQAAVKRGLCRDCYDAGREDEDERRREDEKIEAIDTAGLDASIATCERVTAALRGAADSIDSKGF